MRYAYSVFTMLAVAVALVFGLGACGSSPVPSQTLDSAGKDACNLAVTLTTSGMTNVDDVRAMREEVEDLVSQSGFVGFGSDPFIADIIDQCWLQGFAVQR